MEDEPFAGRTLTSITDDNVEGVGSLVSSDHWLTLRMISSELNLNQFTIHQIFTQDLAWENCAPRWFQRLTTEHKANWRDVFLDLLDCLEREPEFFSRVITGDESWILEYDPKRKRQSQKWHTANSPRPKKARMNKSIYISFSLTVRGSSSRNLCQQDKLSIELIMGSPWKPQENVAHVRPGIAHTWMLHHDNAPCYTAVSINEFLAEKSIPVVPQPPIHLISVPVTSFYSPAQKPLERAPFRYFG